MKTNNLKKALKKKGFKEDNSRHLKYTLYYEGKKTSIITVISHSHKEISAPLVKRIMAQLKFDNREQFNKYVECSMSEEQYVQMLKDKKVIK
jgi:predicted RNA binding protein YcfA (HicA-like mRNA interferase family)